MKWIQLCFLRILFVPLSVATSSAWAFDLTNVPEPSDSRRIVQENRESLAVYQHHLNYFISGEPDTKVQLSFKVRVLRDVNFFAAYTQTMFWELFIKDSSPFSDLNFNPELFHRWYFDAGMFKGLDIGAEHRSNGRSGLDSRSWNRSYVNAHTELKAFDWIPLDWDTKLFYLYDLDKTNPDIRHKLGFIETTLTLKNLWPRVLTDGQVYFTLIPGGTWNFQKLQGSREIGFKFRLPFEDFNPFVYFQYYNGINESQLFYKESRSTYRIGLAI